MSPLLPKSGRPESRNFDPIKVIMLQSDELSLVEILDGNQWRESCWHRHIDVAWDAGKDPRDGSFGSLGHGALGFITRAAWV